MAITMEELKQKARAYDEAIERAKKNYDVAQDLCSGSQIGVECFKNTLTHIFPELKENRDDKIRKLLIRLFTSNTNEKFDDVSTQEIIAWLEEQGEKLSQQEVTKISDQEKDFIEIPFGAKDSEFIGDTYFIPEGCYAVIVDDMVVIKKGERKPAWNEEDEHKVKDTIYFLDTAKKHYASTVELDACIDWLKSLKDKVQPQSQQEWSEEDDNMLTDAIGAVGAADYYTFDDKQEIENWLKCLKQKIVG